MRTGSVSGRTPRQMSKASAADVRAARNLVEKARAALAEGKKKKCENLIKKAQDKLEDG